MVLSFFCWGFKGLPIAALLFGTTAEILTGAVAWMIVDLFCKADLGKLGGFEMAFADTVCDV